MNTIGESAFWPGVARLSAWPQLWRRAKINKREMELVPEQHALEQFLKRADNGFDFLKAEIVKELMLQSSLRNRIIKLQSQLIDESGKRDKEIVDHTIILGIYERTTEINRKDPRVDTICVQAEGILDIYHDGVMRTREYPTEADSRMAAASSLLAHLNELEDKAR